MVYIGLNLVMADKNGKWLAEWLGKGCFTVFQMLLKYNAAFIGDVDVNYRKLDVDFRNLIITTK